MTMVGKKYEEIDIYLKLGKLVKENLVKEYIANQIRMHLDKARSVAKQKIYNEMISQNEQKLNSITRCLGQLKKQLIKQKKEWNGLDNKDRVFLAKNIRKTEDKIEYLQIELHKIKRENADHKAIICLAEKEAYKQKFKITINLMVDRQDFFNHNNKLKKVYDELSYFSKLCDLNIEIYENLQNQSLVAPINYSYTLKELDEIVEFYNYMNGYQSKPNRKNTDIYFRDSATCSEEKKAKLSLGEVYFINKKIEDIARYIKGKQYTPYEAMIYIHRYLTGYEYTKTDNSSRMIIGPLNYGGIVCSGYVSLTKAIIDRLDMPNLECNVKPLIRVNANRSDFGNSAHTICLISIEDKQYNINGTYYNDTTWDSRVYGECGKIADFTHFLYPISDIKLLQEEDKPKVYVDADCQTRNEQIINVKAKDFNKKLYEFENEEGLLMFYDRLCPERLNEEYNPIPIETLIKGLYNVFETSLITNDEYKGQTTAEVVYSIIMASMEKSLTVYRKQCQNDMMRIWRENGYYNSSDKSVCIQRVQRLIHNKILKEISKLDNQKIKSNYNR